MKRITKVTTEKSTECTLLDVKACKSQMCLCTDSLLPSVFRHLAQPAASQRGWIMWWITCFFSLSLSTLFVVRHQHYFGAYDHLYQRVAYCNTHICCVYHSDDILGVCKQTVLVWQMFVLRMCNVPAGTALLAAQTVLDTRHCSCSIHLNDPEVHRWKDGRYVGGYQDNRSFFFKNCKHQKYCMVYLFLNSKKGFFHPPCYA